MFWPSLHNTESNYLTDFSSSSLLMCPSLCVSGSVLELPSFGLCMHMECGSSTGVPSTPIMIFQFGSFTQCLNATGISLSGS